MHLCMASSIRAMPEKEKPPAMRVDLYFAFNCPFRDKHNKTQCELDMAFHSGHSRSVKQKKYSMYFCLTGGDKGL